MPHSKYLSDPTDDVKVATENLLADVLKELKVIASLKKRAEEKAKLAREAEQVRRSEAEKDALPDITMSHPERAAFIPEGDGFLPPYDGDSQAEHDPRDVGSTYFPHLHSFVV